MELPSVTQIISQVGRYWLNFDNVPPDRLEFACQRGSDFHRLAALHAQRLWIDEVPESCVGFFRSFTDWFDEFVVEKIIVEQTLVHPVWNYTGTPDFVGRIKGDAGNCLIDWKTPAAFSKSWVLQCSAYKELAEANGYPISRIATIQLHRDGKRAKFTGFTKSLTPGFAVFLSALQVWRYFNGE